MSFALRKVEEIFGGQTNRVYGVCLPGFKDRQLKEVLMSQSECPRTSGWSEGLYTSLRVQSLFRNSEEGIGGPFGLFLLRK